jgi:hypothetical protein
VSAQIFQFPKPANTFAATAAVPPRRSVSETQEQARRIVAQVEREIATQAYEERLQMRLRFSTPPPVVVEMETPGTVARRILHAILAFARSA